jgi:putative peptidoglycan lipid II flippase
MVSAFYAFQDTKTPVKVAAVAMAANGLFSLLLMGPLKHGGLALALSLASTLQFVILVFVLEKRRGIFEVRPVLRGVLKSLLASSVMGLAVFFLHARWLSATGGGAAPDLALRLPVTVLIGAGVYFITAAFLRCDELSSVLELVRRRTRVKERQG